MAAIVSLVLLALLSYFVVLLAIGWRNWRELEEFLRQSREEELAEENLRLSLNFKEKHRNEFIRIK